MCLNETSPATILAVDDSLVIQKMVRQTLGENYRILVASNTLEALGQLHHDSIDLMLLDIAMPGVDGLELCRIIRRTPHLEKLPIIMLTARDTVCDKIEGRLAGATEYLTKPFDPEQLQITVHKILTVAGQMQ
ncbi:MAG: response regulator [Limnospira sp. PMC 1291.21]|uniref:Two-component response regulator n=4 Tax=Limnospira TaxID=2596745 RepID=A0A9P1P156_9CYAN|nr:MULTISPECIES: response regulator [Limnospira]EKD08873.1 response regulator receiver protein [Arthrospira platensis C1]MDC0838237.1 response regulator [Limnoraphis robusta]MDY7054990.1 response regulator [Limnospira fusiformis LS22]QJB29307.1 response regulator [Limnospira fusiformis SAG 85.79]EDZ92329.1 response regulator receiver protein [Limnospira maxima CS-328]